MKQVEYFPNTGETFMADELLPCPFCGSEAKVMFIGNDYTKSRKVTVKCSEIHCRVQRTDAALKNNHEWVARVAIEGWNKRVNTKQYQYCTVCNKKCEKYTHIGFPLCDEHDKNQPK